MFAIEDIMNVPKDVVHNLWKFHSEQLKLEKSSLAGHLQLLQINYLDPLLSV